MKKVLEGSLGILRDERIWDEYRNVLNRKEFPFDREEITAFLEFVWSQGEGPLGSVQSLSLPDPEDRPFLEVALAGNADCLVTGNLRHFPAVACRGLPVVSPRAFLDLL